MISFCLLIGAWEMNFSLGRSTLVEELDPTSVAGDYDIAEEHDEPVTGFGRPGDIKGSK